MRAPLPGTYRMEDVVTHSVADYHVKGLDYLCLERSLEYTLKLYFFDGDVTRLPEVVCPHDHRYDFTTHCLSGAVRNRMFRVAEAGHGRTFNLFTWRTPLNGGDGFTFAREENLVEAEGTTARAGQRYRMRANALHTIRLVEPETILCIEQFEDKVSLDGHTRTYCIGDAPDLDGLYGGFSPDRVRTRLAQLERVTGIAIRQAP